MRTTKTLSVTLPPEMLARATEIAQREHRTMSEPVREALREYERKNWWAEMNAYGRARADKLGLDEDDIDATVKEVRREMRANKKKPSKP